MCRERLTMRALHFSISTFKLNWHAKSPPRPGRARALLALEAQSPIFISAASSSTLLQCGCQNCPPMPPLAQVVKMIGTNASPRCRHRAFNVSVSFHFTFSVGPFFPAFALRGDCRHAPTPEWLAAFGSTMLWTSHLDDDPLEVELFARCNRDFRESRIS
jgi:hypothetical protein